MWNQDLAIHVTKTRKSLKNVQRASRREISSLSDIRKEGMTKEVAVIKTRRKKNNRGDMVLLFHAWKEKVNGYVV